MNPSNLVFLLDEKWKDRTSSEKFFFLSLVVPVKYADIILIQSGKSSCSYLFKSFVETVKYILSGTVMCTLGYGCGFFASLKCPRAIEIKTEHFSENAISVKKNVLQ